MADQPEKPQEASPEAPKEKSDTKPVERFQNDNIRPGATIRVSQKIVEGTKERIQVFEGMILSRRGKKMEQSTITVRKLSQGFGVERIFPLALPTITKIEVVKQAQVRRAKLNYLRNPRAKKLKEKA